MCAYLFKLGGKKSKALMLILSVDENIWTLVWSLLF